MNFEEDDDLDLDLLDEVVLVPENEVQDSIETKYDLFLTLKGLMITEELDTIKNLCSKDEIDKSLPLFVVVDDCSKEVGYLELSLDVLLTLFTLNPNYVLSLHDKENNVVKDILSPNIKDVGKTLENFIVI